MGGAVINKKPKIKSCMLHLLSQLSNPVVKFLKKITENITHKDENLKIILNSITTVY